MPNIIGAPSPESVDPVIEEHSKLGPSAAERWINCPGSYLATKGAPDTSSKYAAEGTAAHTLSEWCREQNKPAEDWIGHQIHSKGDRIAVTWEMVRATQEFVDYVEALPGEGFVEERVHYDAFIPTGFGTADDIRITEDGECYVTDLKYGKGIQVYAKNNTQLKLYALGVFQDFGHLYNIENFHLCVHQPRLEHVDVWEISTLDLLKWVKDVAVPAAEIALKPGAPFKAGKWCQFCAINATCETRNNAMQEEYLADLDGVDTLSGDKLAAILNRIPEIKAWCSDVEAHALSEVQKGNEVGGYKLVEGRSQRRWKDSVEAENALRKTKLKVAEIFVKKMISPKQAEDLLGKNHPVITGQVTKPQGKPVLVPPTDSRPPLQVSAEDEFEDLSNNVE